MTPATAIEIDKKLATKAVYVNEARVQIEITLKQLRTCIEWLGNAYNELDIDDEELVTFHAIEEAYQLANDFHEVMRELSDKINEKEVYRADH